MIINQRPTETFIVLLIAQRGCRGPNGWSSRAIKSGQIERRGAFKIFAR